MAVEIAPVEVQGQAPAPAPAPAPELYKPEPGKVAITDRDGSVSVIAEGDLERAVTAEGARPASYPEYMGQKLGALGKAASAGIAAARGASFGLSDKAAIEVSRFIGGDAEAEDTRRAFELAQKANPGVSLGAEVGGSLLPLLFSGGAGAAGEAATAEGMLARAGQRIAAAAPRAIGEGALIGVGQQLSEDALGNKQLVAENYVQSAVKGGVLGLILGGGAGAGLGAAGDALGGALGRLTGGAERAAGKLTLAGEDAVGVAQKAGDALAAEARGAGKGVGEAMARNTFGEPAPGIGEALRQKLVSASAGVSGRDRAAIEKLGTFDAAGREARRIAVFDSDKELEAVHKGLRTAGDEMMVANKLTMGEFQGSLKAEKIAGAVKTGNEGAVVDYARSQIAKVVELAESELRHADGVAPQAVKSLEGIARTAYHAEAEVLQAAAKGQKVNETAFMQLDRLKRDVQAWVDGGYKGVVRIADPFEARLARRSVEALDRSQQALRSGLEDAELWGKAGDIQKAINAEWTIQLEAAGRFKNALTTEVGRDPTNPFLKARGMDPSKLETYTRGLLNPNADLTHQAVKDYVGSTRRLAEVLKENVDLAPDKLAQVDKIIKSAGTFRTELDKAEKVLTLVNQYKGLGGSDGFGTAAAVVGGALGGPVGSAVAGALGTLANPQRAVAQIAALERMAIKADEKIGAAVRSFFGAHDKALTAGAKAAEKAGEDVAGGATRITSETIRALREATRSPEAMAALVERTIAPFKDAAPEVARSIATTVMRAGTFVATSLPTEPTPRSLMWTPKAPRAIGTQALAQTARKLNGASLESVLNSIAKQRISRSQIETFKQVYPESFARVQQEMRKLGAELRPSLSTQQEVAMSILFDTPATAIMQPKTIAGFQSTFAQGSQPEGAAAGGQQPMPPGRPMGNIGASRSSGTDRLEASS